MTYRIIAIIVALVVLVVIAIVGLITDLLREKPRPVAVAGAAAPPQPPYSFHKFQLWIWTMVICPAFILHWGYSPNLEATINQTGLILLGIASATTVTAEVITASQKSAMGPAALKMSLASKQFWQDILMDDSGQFSIARLQQLIFTFIYVVVYIGTFFKTDQLSYPEFETNAYILMGISTGAFLLGKGLNK